MMDETPLNHKNRCYVFVDNNINIKCNVCNRLTGVKIYSYQRKDREVKGVASYCPKCDIYYLYYGNYVGQSKYWEVLNTKEDIERISVEYRKIVSQKKERKVQRRQAKKIDTHMPPKYYELPKLSETLEKERAERNEKAIENRKRGEKEKEKTDEIKKKLELKEKQRLQQLKESEAKREREFQRRLAESRRRSEERKRNAKRGIIVEAEVKKIVEAEVKKSEPIIPIKQAEPKNQVVLPDSELKAAKTEYNGQFDLRKHLIENGHLKNLQEDDVVPEDNTVSNRNGHAKKMQAVQSERVKPAKQTNKKKEALNRAHDIDAHDFVVRSSSSVFRCRNKAHTLKDIRATFVSISRNGTVNTIEIPAGYCPQCKTYFILESTYQRIKRSGVPICRTMDEKTYHSNPTQVSSNDISMAQESVLMQFGYTVSQNENLPAIQRRAILATIVDYHVLTRNEVVSYLDYFIKFRKNQKNPDGSLKFEIAIDKWKDDRDFISKHKIGTYTQVAMRRIVANN